MYRYGSDISLHTNILYSIFISHPLDGYDLLCQLQRIHDVSWGRGMLWGYSRLWGKSGYVRIEALFVHHRYRPPGLMCLYSTAAKEMHRTSWTLLISQGSYIPDLLYCQYLFFLIVRRLKPNTPPPGGHPRCGPLPSGIPPVHLWRILATSNSYGHDFRLSGARSSVHVSSNGRRNFREEPVFWSIPDFFHWMQIINRCWSDLMEGGWIRTDTGKW
jgi:hypothetical protein